MVAIYVLVRIAQLVLSGVLLILGIIELTQELSHSYYDKTYVTTLAITVVVLFVGAWGSYKHNRAFLFTFALIMLCSIIMGFFAQTIHYSPIGTSIALVILSLTQAELIRQGHV